MKGFELKEAYGFGYIETLSQGLDKLIVPGFSIAALGVIFYFLMGAFTYLTSAGDKERVGKAQAMITHSIIGFLLLMMSFVIIKFIPEFLQLKDFAIIK